MKFKEEIMDINTLKTKLLKGLFIRQIFMQIEKYELYNIFNTNYFSDFSHSSDNRSGLCDFGNGSIY